MTAALQVKTCLWFNSTGHQAAQLYCDLLPDSEIQAVVPSPTGDPDAPPLEVHFRLGTQEYVALNGGNQYELTPAVSIQLHVDGQAELDRIWSALVADGGEEGHCGWLVDRFGVSWQVIPTRFVELVTTDDAAANKRVIEQMQTMSKLDIAPLEAAAAKA